MISFMVSSDLVVMGDLYPPPTVKDQDCASMKVSSGFTFTAFEQFLGSSKDLHGSSIRTKSVSLKLPGGPCQSE